MFSISKKSLENDFDCYAMVMLSIPMKDNLKLVIQCLKM